MRDELTLLLGMFHKVEEAGGTANLTISTKGGKSSIKFAIELDAESSTSNPASTPSTSPPAPGNQAAGRRRRRNRGAAARARRNQRAATSQATLAEVESPPHLPPSRPLHHLLSPSPTSGRRRVMSLGRGEMPTFSTLNLDGSSSPSPAPPPPSPPPSRYPSFPPTLEAKAALIMSPDYVFSENERQKCISWLKAQYGDCKT